MVLDTDTKPLAAGGMRWCVRMNFMGKDRQNRTFVAKVFKPDAVSADQVRCPAVSQNLLVSRIFPVFHEVNGRAAVLALTKPLGVCRGIAPILMRP